MTQPWLRAGLIGAAVMLVIGLIGLIPILSCLTLPLELFAFIGIGALAGSSILPRRAGGRAAGQGALAGLIAGLASGIITVILAPLGFNMAGGSNAIINQLPAQTLEQFEQAGIDPAMFFNTGTATGFTALCCLPTGLIVGAVLGALGGLIYASVKPE